MTHEVSLPIAHNRPMITDKDRAAVDAVLRSNWIAQGEQVSALEQDFVDLFGSGQACANASGTASLLLALHGARITTGDAVVVPTYACTALLNAIYMVGANPVVVDVKPDDFTINPVSLQMLTPRIKPAAVIAVHTFGARADIAALREWSDYIVEDCCQSLGTTFDGAYFHPCSTASVFSFYATKVITGGQGGLLWSRNDDIVALAKEYREPHWGMNLSPRFNIQMTDMQAALVRSQLSRLFRIIERRRHIASRYLEAAQPHFLMGIEDIDHDRLYYRFVLRTPSEAHTEKLEQFFLDRGITVSRLFQPHELLHRYLQLDRRAFSEAERIAVTTLSLPIYSAMTEAELDYVCSAINQAKRVA